MTELTFQSWLVLCALILGGMVFIALFFISVPYGRHFRGGWGASLPSYLGWMIMEAPAALLFAVFFWLGNTKNLVACLFLAMWEMHYIHRAFIYPLTLSDGRKKMPVLVLCMAFLFNIGNAYNNGRYLFTLSGGYPQSWLIDPRFLCGLAVFLAGYTINRWADHRLRGLRKPGEIGYRIPYGGLYQWVSCPNYLGEIIEWCGWALATWSLPGLVFAIWTVANLAPRARSHHAWYRQHFPDYPPERKALIPGIW